MAFTYNYIVKNEMTNFTAYTTFIDEVVAVDDLTVEIRLQQAQGQHAHHLDARSCPEHVWSKVAPSAAARSFVRTRRPSSAPGPFQVDAGEEGPVRARCGATRHFWGPKPAIDEIVFATYQNPDTMTQDMTAGNLDAAWGIPSAQFTKLQSDEGVTPIAYNQIHWDYLSFNCYEGPVAATRRSRTWPSARRSTGRSTGSGSSTSRGRVAASRATRS